MSYEINKYGGWIVPAKTILMDVCIPARSNIGPGCTIEPGCTIGPDCTIEPGCTISSYCTIGSGCTMEGVIMEQFLTMTNVDGSGRSLLIIKHADGVLIRAGCFVGTEQEFIRRARAEGKSKYVGIIGAIVAALEAENER